MKHGFSRLFVLDDSNLEQFVIAPFEEFKEKILKDELLGTRQPDHVSSASLDMSLNSAEAFVVSKGAGLCLTAEPGVVVLSDRRMFPSSAQNYAFVWRLRSRGRAIVVPLARSAQLIAIEETRKWAGVRRRARSR